MLSCYLAHDQNRNLECVNHSAGGIVVNTS
jgi:hypothetical protein